jgi:O-methyltransferase involved in polyketide biosynthesis
MAREAGWGFSNSRDSDFVNAQLKFAELVAAVEREKVAAWMMQRGYATGHGDTTEDLLQELDWQVKERGAL